MITWTALTTLPGKAKAHALSEALEDVLPAPTGVGVLEVEDGSGLWEVGAYFVEPPDDIALSLLAAAFEAKDFAVSELPETDWVAKVKRELAPVHVGRFIVHGSHDEVVPDADQIALLVEASMAFGTGHHGTTTGCLSVLDQIATQGVQPARVADIGCGSAVLAMAAARVWEEAQVWASDIDELAVEVASHNCTVNGLSGITCLEAAGFEAPALADAAPFDLIFANILMGPLLDLAPAMAAHLAPGGAAILSGVLDHQADRVAHGYAAAGLPEISRETIGEWVTLCVRKTD